MDERKWGVELEEKILPREIEFKKIQIQDTSREHIHVNPRRNPGKQYEIHRLLTISDNSSNISLYFNMYEKQMVQTGFYAKNGSLI